MDDLTVKIDKAGKLDAKIKESVKELKALKLDLADHFKATGSKKELGDAFEVSFSVTPKYSEINPVDCHTLLQARGVGEKLLEVVKVQVTPLKKFLSGEEVESLREKIDETVNVKLGKIKK